MSMITFASVTLGKNIKERHASQTATRAAADLFLGCDMRVMLRILTPADKSMTTKSFFGYGNPG